MAPQQGYDEPGILSYAIRPFCPTNADGLHLHEGKRAAFTIKNAKQIEEKIRDLNDRLEVSINLAVMNFDHKLLSQTVQQALALRWELRRDEDMWRHPDSYRYQREETKLDEFEAARIDDVVGKYRVIHEQMDRSRIIDLVGRYKDELDDLPPEYSIPAVDRELLSREDEWTSCWSKSGLESDLSTIERQRIEYIVRHTRRPDEKEKPKKPQEREGGKIPRWIAASIRVLSGTALTGANGLLGIAGLAGTWVSLGGMTIPVAVGVAVSVNTGLGQVADGLEKIGALLKD